MRAYQIFLVGLAGLVFVFLSTVYVGWFGLGLALLPAIFVLAGFLFFPARGCGISVSLNPEIFQQFEEAPAEVVVTVSGAKVTLGPLMRHIKFQIERRNYFLLGLVIIASFAVTAWAWPSRNSGLNEFEERLLPGHVIYYGASLWMVVGSIGYKWLLERRLLSGSMLTLATVEELGPAKLGGHIVRYSFTDLSGERFGATARHHSRLHSDLELVFYSADNPNRSCHASGLLFYKVVSSGQAAGAASDTR